MSNLQAHRVTLAGKLYAAGLPAQLDPRAVPPFVLVDAPTVNGGIGIGGWSVEYPVRVVAPPPGNAEALVWLLEQTELILRTLGPAAADPGTYDADGKACPAYTLTYPADVPNPDC